MKRTPYFDCCEAERLRQIITEKEQALRECVEALKELVRETERLYGAGRIPAITWMGARAALARLKGGGE